MTSILQTCRPRADILTGAFNPEIFTASLGQVLKTYRGEPSISHAIYTHAEPFFREATYGTEGLRRVLQDVFGRLSGDNSYPAIHRLETGFGGGKTHTLIALTHLAYRGRELMEVAASVLDPHLLPESGSVTVVGVAGDTVLVHKPQGTRLVPYTLWGEIAYQVGGEALYRQVENVATSRAAPDEGFLQTVFQGRRVLIMLDELAQYAARLAAVHPTNSEQLAAFLMALLGYASTHTGIAVVVTLASRADAFAARTEDLARLLSEVRGEQVDTMDAVDVAERARRESLSVVDRHATSVVPVQSSELSRVLARRLFERIDTQAARATADAYLDMYGRSAAALPEGVNQADYRDRLVEHYPFHPTFIGFLTRKLSQVESFQGTRGVLRVLALAVRRLWEQKHKLPMIHTCHLDLRDERIVTEVMSRTDNTDLIPPLEADVGSVGSGSLDTGLSVAAALDRANPHPAALPYHEWTWKTVFLHSLVGRAEGLGARQFGIFSSDALLEVSQPELTPPQVEKALEAIRSKAYYLRERDGRYYADTAPTLNRILETIRAGIQGPAIQDELKRMARDMVRQNTGDFAVVSDVSEPGFPCHQVGAETQREQSVGLQPPVNRLHVWWARRPLTPSRAAIVASLDPVGTEPESFVRQLGIERVEALIQGEPWVLSDNLRSRIERQNGIEELRVDAAVRRALEKERERREENRQLIADLKRKSPDLANDSVLRRWEAECRPLPMSWPEEGETLPIQRITGDPAWAKLRITWEDAHKVRTADNKYQYPRAFANNPAIAGTTDLVVLDPTAGGGSIPFEALRLGHRVIANELNPVASVILHATLDYPARCGVSLHKHLKEWGKRLRKEMVAQIGDLFPASPLPETELNKLRKLLRTEALSDFLSYEHLDGFIYCRQVTCPHCHGEFPLLNTKWLSKTASDPWAVRIVPDGKSDSGTVRFETYRVRDSKGPNGENPNSSTVNRGVGSTCIHCNTQAISGDEIKAQARGESEHGRWRDRLYAVVAVRYQPKLDKDGSPQYYRSGERVGELKTEKVRFFRPPNAQDLEALAEAERRLAEKWDDWEAEGLIPTEPFPRGNDMRPLQYGMNRWCDLFTPRQLLGHVTLVEALNRLKPKIIEELGEEKGRAVVTYLQFAIDKGVDYNSKQTRWHFSRGAVVGTFGRHDFSLKWTFGEMIFTGPSSGAAWGLSQILDAYKGLAELTEPVHRQTGGNPPVRILNGTAAYMAEVADSSVDLVCMDPPYYDNVQYAELSDYFYVWQKRTLRDLYPGLFERRLTDKDEEAVANPARDGKQAKARYEQTMGEIFRECRRVLKEDGIMTLMFTHKSLDAWETLTRSLIEAGWTITASFPVESEGQNSMHQRDMAAAASSIFIACRKRAIESAFPAVWKAGGRGVQEQVREAVVQGIRDFKPLRLNPVDRMVACYGRALQVLSEHWPVVDGDEPVSPVRAMNEASRVVAEHEVGEITGGRLRVEDLDAETRLAVLVYDVHGHSEFPYDEALNLSRSLNLRLESKPAGYRAETGLVGINAAAGRRAASYAAPFLRQGSKLRLAAPEERDSRRLANPQTDWDRLHGLITEYRRAGEITARDYLDKHAEDRRESVLALLDLWIDGAATPQIRKEGETIRFGLQQTASMA